MRRIVASLVLSVMAWSFLAPMALALTGNDSPACCRRNGKHHCMSVVSGAVASDGDSPAFRVLPSRCPYGSEIATQTVAAWLKAPRTSEHQLASEVRAVQPEFLALYFRSRGPISLRGPPA